MISSTCDNGLRYAVRQSGTAVAYCAMSIRCGSRVETESDNNYHGGVAHFVEHCLFKGTKKKSASTINNFIDKLGGELNAYTTKEEIVIHATVLKDDLYKAAKLLFELSTEPIFQKSAIEIEKSVVIDEIAGYKDSPAEDIYDLFEELLFNNHPLGGRILGTKQSVKAIKQEELVKFVKEFFVPERMAFTVVSPKEEKQVEKLILNLNKQFFQVENTAKKENASINPDGDKAYFKRTPVTREIFNKTIHKKNYQANCILGSFAPSLYEEKERLATILLTNILGGPANNSILNAILREKHGLVYNIECSYTQYYDTGIFAICLGCDKENLDKCLEFIHKEIEKIQNSGFSESKLKAAKKQLLGQLAISSESGENQCLSMGKGLLSYGKVSSSKETIEKVNSVSNEDIIRIAKSMLGKEDLSQLVYVQN